MKNLIRIFIVFSLIGIFCEAVAAPTIPHYAGGGTINIGGEGKWDFCAVDPTHRRLYVSHGSQVNIVDLATRLIVGEIPDQHGVHGIAFAPEFNRGFISNGGDNSVTIFDLYTMKSIGRIDIPAKKPDAMIYDPFSKRVFAFNAGSDNATAIDAKTGTIAGSVALDGAPEFAASDGKGKMFVNLEDQNAVNVFDSQTLKVLAKWPLAPCGKPTGMAIDREHQRLFIGGRNKIFAVMDATSGAIVTTLPIDAGCDAVVFEQSSQCAFSSNGSGTVTQIYQESPTSYRVVATLPTTDGARTMALDEATHKIFLPAMLMLPHDATTDVTVPDKKSFGLFIEERNN